MKITNYLLSICIPTYNRFNYLTELVEDIFSQHGYSTSTIELIIAQDRFKDGQFCKKTEEYGKALEASFENITYNLTSKNLGLAGNWNNCVNLAKGEYCIILGDDDLFVEGALSTYLDLIARSNADIIFSNHLLIDDKGEVLENSYSNNEKFNRGDLNEGILLDPEKNIWQNAIPISTSAIKTFF
ncbi:glycosyltransferase family 2 protein [Pedobacter sp. SL55]|uniref:glycosyltransferase family 2 protein n=1 Tax=Pedobacter sp. SL55 TaxID=2995161 RepID=UPI00226E7AC5|nr:glycosyltransferase family 2 protein [Pedobacter sp. SL55]WAC39056.1 glycosyltransferase family 2 protein [Pedobacter sp. SL55]